MHRSTGLNCGIEAGKRVYVDQNLGAGVPGTIDHARDMNAVQEELCQVIELAGGTVIGDDDKVNAAELDRVAGYRQVYDTIFEEGRMGNDAFTDNTLLIDKLLLPVTRTDGANSWTQSLIASTFVNGSNEGLYTANYAKVLNAGGAGAYMLPGNLELTDTNTILTKYDARGVRHANGPGNSSSFASSYLRKSAFEISETVSWSQIGTSQAYSATITKSTDIPDTVLSAGGIFSTAVRFGSTVAPATITYTSGAGVVIISTIVAHCATASPGNDFTIFVEYDGSSVVVP